MEKLFNLFGLTTLKQAEMNTETAVKKAVENALNEKPYDRVLNFVRVCRKYNFKVVAVGVEESRAMANARFLAEKEFNADLSEQNDFERLFIPNIKASIDLDLLK